jgi:hypothetical protein
MDTTQLNTTSIVLQYHPHGAMLSALLSKGNRLIYAKDLEARWETDEGGTLGEAAEATEATEAAGGRDSRAVVSGTSGWRLFADAYTVFEVGHRTRKAPVHQRSIGALSGWLVCLHRV